jgi:hypothetical protein
MSLLNGTARAALKRGIANNEIDRPQSLCICARDQRLIAESSFCEMRSWLVLRSRREPLHSGRLWRLRSSSATAETASGRVRIMPSPMERQSTIGCARRAEHSDAFGMPPLRLWMRRGVCFRISVCDQLSNPTSVHLGRRKDFVTEVIQTQNALENRQTTSARLKLRRDCSNAVVLTSTRQVRAQPSRTGEDPENYQSLRSCRLSTCAPKPADPNSPKRDGALPRDR